MPKQRPSASIRRIASSIALASLLLSLLNCKSGMGGGVATEPCGGVACTGATQCQNNLPLCAMPASATCLTTLPRECAWKLNISASCPCMEHDVRLCTASGGVPGVQICTPNSNRTATYWAACVPCPGCA